MSVGVFFLTKVEPGGQSNAGDVETGLLRTYLKNNEC